MGVPTSEVGYASAMPRREDHEVHKDMWGHWGEKILRRTFEHTFLHSSPQHETVYLVNLNVTKQQRFKNLSPFIVEK